MLVIDTSNLEQIQEDDIYEHITELYSTRTPKNSSLGLGYISRSDEIDIDLGVNKVLHIQQSISSFNDSKKTKSGTTGFVTWSVSPLFAKWILGIDKSVSPNSKQLLTSDLLSRMDVVELGTGVAGVLATSVGLKCKKYVATDQTNLLKVLKANIENNVDAYFDSNTLISSSSPSNKSQRKRNGLANAHLPRLEVLEYDWELSDPEVFLEIVFDDKYPDLIIACDTIYNEYLIPYFLESVKALSKIEETGILIGLQLRDSDVMERFLEAVLIDFKFNCFCVPDYMLSEELQNGYVIYYLTRSE